MGIPELKRAITLLRGGKLYPSTIRDAQQLVIASGQRVNDINVALYFSEKGDVENARRAAGRAADTLSRLI
jgi:hypothetical protein